MFKFGYLGSGTSLVSSVSRVRYSSTAPFKPKSAFRRKAFISAAAMATIVTPTALYIQDNSLPERMARSTKFWRQLFPVYLHYRYTDWLLKAATATERSVEFEKLHVKYAPVVLDTILDLRGLYIKIGQVGVTREDMLPKTYRDALKCLLDSVPAISGQDVRKIIEKATGQPLESMFDDFEEEALGAASIGQVHRATWKETGEKCIIKVKYPDSYRLFQSDLNTIRQFVMLAQPEQALIIDEMEKQFMKEFDFNNEGEAMKRVKSNIEPLFPDTVIPAPIYFNRDIIVMEYLQGRKLIDAVMDDYKLIARKWGLTLDELFEKGKTMPKPTARDQLVQRVVFGVRKLYQSLVVAFNKTGILAYNWTFGWFTKPIPMHMANEGMVPPINPPYLTQLLVKVHGHQVLIDGFFNADPHPGNIMLLNDGRLGLIDYGQVKEITEEQRYNFGKMILAILTRDRDHIVDTVYALGMRTEKMDRDVAYELAVMVFDKDDEEIMQGLGFQQKLEEIDKRDRVKTCPEYYIMAVRMGVILRGVASLLKQPPISIAEAWADEARQAVKAYEARHLSVESM
eukprot:Partr_v1_DN26894_c2_g1_i2_m40184 putative AarF domain containing kinase